MKRKFYSLALMAITALAFVACQPKNVPVPPTPDPDPADTITPEPPDTITPEPVDTIPAYFPKKHLIEEFTSQSCGYCPGGMDAVHEFTSADSSNWIVVLHHDGYAKDNFTVAGSSEIVRTLGVNGAPSITVDRKRTRTQEGNTLIFHPGYLPTVDRSKFDSTTYASVNIANTYDAASRELKIQVSGAICDTLPRTLNLTVLVKESGMISWQYDYDHNINWQNFRHCNAVRVFATGAKGELMNISDQRYSLDYTLTLDEAWNPDNCSVVAFITESFRPVVQVAQEPVVAGTQGGNDIIHGPVQ